MLKGYALAVGVGLFVLGLLGLAPAPPDLDLPENMLHLGLGSLFVGGGLLVNSLNQLRGFVGGMGGLLLLGKAVIVGTRWVDLGLHIPPVAVVCLVVGVASVFVAAFVGIGTPSED